MPGHVFEQTSEQTNGYISIVTLSNPGKLNAVDLGMWRELKSCMDRLSQNDSLRMVVLRGEGGEAFAAGGDIVEFIEERKTTSLAMNYHQAVSDALDAIYHCPHPTLARLQGACIGGGLEIAACCDLRITHNSARFGAPINRLGFSMYPGELQRLLGVANPSVLNEILLEGRILSGQEAYQRGLVTRVTEDDRFDCEINATISRVLAGAPLVARWHKYWMRRLSNSVPLSQQEKEDSFAFLTTEDYKEGLSAFQEKRQPGFKGK